MSATDIILDVRQEIPARRHELIFSTHRDLAQGEGFVLVNDHDPKPLYYQFAAEHANQFEWTTSSRVRRFGASASDGRLPDWPADHSPGVTLRATAV